jgi:hypothetical protein
MDGLIDLGGGRRAGLALTFRPVALCDAPERQLQFAFGIRPQPIEEYISTVHAAPLSLALRGPYDYATFRTGGIVWVERIGAPPPYVKHLLLHELGHVFGMKHNSVFVMDERVADLVKFHGAGQLPDMSSHFGHIEDAAWPYTIRPGQVLEPYSGYQREHLPDGWTFTQYNSAMARDLGIRGGSYRLRIKVGDFGHNAAFTVIVDDNEGGHWELPGRFAGYFDGPPDSENHAHWYSEPLDRKPGVYFPHHARFGDDTFLSFDQYPMLLEADEHQSPGRRGVFTVNGKIYGLLIIHHSRGISYTIFPNEGTDSPDADFPSITAPYFIFWLNSLG